MEPRWSELGKERLNNGPGKQECQRLARQRGLRPQIGFREGTHFKEEGTQTSQSKFPETSQIQVNDV